jgi:hypothetical protein
MEYNDLINEKPCTIVELTLAQNSRASGSKTPYSRTCKSKLSKGMSNRQLNFLLEMELSKIRLFS